VKLLIQPGDSVAPLLKGINSARKSVEIVIFRFDRSEIEHALANAVSRGVYVHALIAYTNRGGELNLRKLEMRLLAGGVTVARTANDLARYHDKFMIIDRRELYVLAFNFTYLDIEHSRSFGIITRNRRLVQEAVKLFVADTTRQPYLNGLATLVVSPVNARKRLALFLRGAGKELLIYDPQIKDPAMIRLLEERAAAGVEIKIIGEMTRRSARLAVRKLVQMRLHTRTIIRDGDHAFIGSQSLREVELEKRRELGIIVRDRKVVSRLRQVFAEDWEVTEQYGPESGVARAPAVKVARKVAKAVAEELPPVAPVLEAVIKEVVPEIELNPREVEETVKQAVKEAVKEAVQEVVEQVANGKEP
jgi:phosphatidylserine/phosphatidylglycerophosphate/cardiolipin synthase-like enzyme